MLRTGLLLRICSLCFLRQPRAGHLPGMAPPTTSSALTHESLIPKCSQDLPRRRSDGGIFLAEVLSSQLTLGCIKVTRTSQHAGVGGT